MLATADNPLTPSHTAVIGGFVCEGFPEAHQPSLVRAFPRWILVNPRLLKQIAPELKHSDLAGLAKWLGLTSPDDSIRGLVLHVSKNHRVDVYFRNLKDPDNDALACSWKLPKSRVAMLLTDDPHEH